MIYLLGVYFLFLLAWFGLSYFVAHQLKIYGFVGDASKKVTRIYFIISGLIIISSLIIIMSA